MTRFSGVVGFKETEEDPPDSGDFKAVITEISYFGDVIRDTVQGRGEDKIHTDISVSNQISIVADEYALANYHAIVYVLWNGIRWTVPTVQYEYPRLTLSPGEVYHGPLPAEPEDPPED